jgi:hypothetical protein
MMSDYNSKSKTGGKINSKIDNQDSVAAIYAIEQLNNPDIFNFDISINDYSIKCEGNDDIEIINNDYHIFIQVKSSTINNAEFTKTMESFLNNSSLETDKKSFFVISAFECVKINNKNFTDRLHEYINVYHNKFESDSVKKDIKNTLLSDFSMEKYKEIIDYLTIDTRPLFRDNKDTKAIFARYLRLAYGFKDHGEKSIDNLFILLTNTFAELRRNRNFIEKSSIEAMLGKELCRSSYLSGMSLALGYTRTENGYVKDKTLISKRESIELGAKKAVKIILSNWRKAYLKEFLKSSVFGAKRCPICGHPMIANINGLKGIACPDCGYNPYVTMIAFCECGEFEVVKTQPELTDDKIFNYLNDFFSNRNDTYCKSCKKDLLDDCVEERIMLLSIPIPFDEYKNIDIIYKNSKY